MSDTSPENKAEDKTGTEEIRKPNLSFWITAFVLGIVYIYLQVIPLIGTHGEGSYKSNQNDFKHIYLGAQIMAEGSSPYDADLMIITAGAKRTEDYRFQSILPYVYLPFTGIVIMPLSWLEFDQAADTFQIINHLCLIGGLVLLCFAMKRRWNWKTACLIFLPIIFNWCVYRSHNAGQLNSVLFFGACLLFWMLTKGLKAQWVGLAAAFLMLFKITPGIFLIWFLLTKRFREATWMIGWALGFTLLSVLIVGFQTHLDFLPVLSNMGFGKSTWAEYGHTFWRDPYNQSVNSFFHNLFNPDPKATNGVFKANLLTWIFALGLLAVFAGSHFRYWFSSFREDSKSEKEFGTYDQLSFSAALLVSLLAPSIMWDHYLLQALLPAFVLWEICRRTIAEKRIRLIAMSMIVLFYIITSIGFFPHQRVLHASTLGVSGVIEFFWKLPEPVWILRNIWMSIKLWPTLMLLLMVLIVIYLCSRDEEIVEPSEIEESKDWRKLLEKRNRQDRIKAMELYDDKESGM